MDKESNPYLGSNVEQTLGTAVNVLEDIGEMLSITEPKVHSLVICRSNCNEIVKVLINLAGALKTEKDKIGKVPNSKRNVVRYLPLS